MPYNLKGRNVLVTGGSAGIGKDVCLQFAQEGANLAINYFNREEPAEELRKKCEELSGGKAVIIKADMTVMSQAKVVVDKTIELLGGIDVIIANAGWTRFAEWDDLDALSEEEWDKCFSANVKVPKALLSAARTTFEKNADGGQMITTGSIGGISIGGSSMAYSVTKAAQFHMVRCLAATVGPKIRVNTVLPGLVVTEWTQRYGDTKLRELEERAVLKRAVDSEDCAAAFIMLAKNTSMTGMRIQVDCGLNVPCS